LNCFCIFNSGTDFGYIYAGSSTSDGDVYAFDKWQPYLVISRKSELELGTFDDTRTLGTELNASLEIAWDCTIDTWLTELQTKDASISTIDDIVTYLPDATIDRPDTAGTWTSPVYNIDAHSLDLLKWNETLGGSGDITFQIRTGGVVVPDGTWTAWSVTPYTDPNGSVISGETGNTYVQLRANLSTTDIDYSPYLTNIDDFIIKLSYTKSGATYESDFNSFWQSGWLNFGIPQDKKIESITVFYEGTSGDLNFGIQNDEGIALTGFDIDMSVPPSTSSSDTYFGTSDNKYFIYYPPIYAAGQNPLIGDAFKFSLSYTGIIQFKVKKIRIKYAVQDITD